MNPKGSQVRNRVLLLLAVLLVQGCELPFARTGPRFDARHATNTVSHSSGSTTPQTGSGGALMTNFTSVTLTNELEPEWLRPPSEPLVLGPGDKIELGALTAYYWEDDEFSSRGIFFVQGNTLISITAWTNVVSKDDLLTMAKSFNSISENR